MKLLPTALSFICLVAAPQEASSTRTPPADNDPFANGINHMIAAVESELQSNSNSKSNSNRQLEDFFFKIRSMDDDFWQCTQDSANLFYDNPDLKQAQLDYASSIESTHIIDDDLAIAVTVEIPQEARDLLQQACSDVRGIYKETNGPIICYGEYKGFGVVGTLSNYATCYAETVECDSVDPAELATVALQSIGIKGECSEDLTTPTPVITTCTGDCSSGVVVVGPTASLLAAFE